MSKKAKTNYKALYEAEREKHAEFARKGGNARAAKLTKLRQSEIASIAALARWANHRKATKS